MSRWMPFVGALVLLSTPTLSFQPRVSSLNHRIWNVNQNKRYPNPCCNGLFRPLPTATTKMFRIPESQQRNRPATVLKNTSQNSLVSRLRQLLRRWTRWTRNALTAFALAVFLLVSTSVSPAWAAGKGTGGRVGGSFKSSSMSRPMPSRSTGRSYSSNRPPSRLYSAPSPIVVMPRSYPSTGLFYRQPAPRLSPTSVIFTAGVVFLFYQGFKTKLREMDESEQFTSALGRGFSVCSLTVALNVQNRDDPNGILAKLKNISQTAQTNTRRGVQNLVSEVVLALLRQQDTIVSALTSYQHFRSERDAERSFHRLSLRERSKFQRETVSKFGDKDQSDSLTDSSAASEEISSATSAVVTINLSIEGDSTKLPLIKTRESLNDALGRIGADVLVEDCLLAAEVLWTPEERDDTLTRDDVYTKYPALFPLL